MNTKIINTSLFDSDKSYQNLLAEIKGRLKNAQLRAAIVVNHELIKFYWDIGKLIRVCLHFKFRRPATCSRDPVGPI